MSCISVVLVCVREGKVTPAQKTDDHCFCSLVCISFQSGANISLEHHTDKHSGFRVVDREDSDHKRGFHDMGNELTDHFLLLEQTSKETSS